MIGRERAARVLIGSFLSANQSSRCALSTNQNFRVVIKTKIVHKVGTGIPPVYLIFTLTFVSV